MTYSLQSARHMDWLTPPAVATALEALPRLPHPVLARIRQDARESGVPIVDPLTGAFLHTLTRAAGATKVLEIGTAIGYSTAWMATALPADGLLVSLERDHGRAARARAFLAEAGLDDRVNVMIGEADRYLHKLAGPFDLIFQDGDTAHYGPLLDKLERLLRPGGVLVTNRVLRVGEIGPDVAAFNDRLAQDPRFTTTVLPIGDGVAMAVRMPGRPLEA